jgi:hypothetical protein
MATRKKVSKAAKNVAAVKAKRGKKTQEIRLPDGYKVVGRAPNWDADKHPVLEGARGETKAVTLNAGTKDEKETQCMVVVSEELGAVTVWESAGLRDLFEQTEDGDSIRIEYTHTLPPRKKGQQGMRVFSCAVKE